MARNEQRKEKQDRGFTLLEVLIAFIIAAFALAALFSASLTALATLRSGTGYESAVARARSRLAVEAVGLVAGERSGTDSDGYRWHVLVRQVDGVRTGGGGPDDPPVTTFQLFQVEVAVAWGDGGRGRSVRLETERLRVARGAAP